MKTLVLGGAGFIGCHLADRLSRDGHAVTVVDDLSRGRADAELAAVLDRPGVRFVQADLTERASFDALGDGWDQIWMLAAIVGVRNVERDPARVVRVNTLAALHLVDWAPTGTGMVFFASTSEAYAAAVDVGVAPVPTPEEVLLGVTDVTHPRFAYAASKILGEAAVVHGLGARGVPFVIGRFHNVYGPRMGADHVIPELALRALAREDPFPVWSVDQRRAFCYVSDAVDAMLALAATREAHGQIVNIGNDTDEVRIGDLAALVLGVVGHAPRVEPRPAPSGSIARRCPDLARLRRLTGFVPKVPLETGVRATLSWYRAWRERSVR
jgi:UDP-glucose 4-epimerase/UDP-glucuronate decarboxylase